MSEHFPAEVDYVVIGAGSAGCVLSDRLSASGRDSVLVLEAGGSDRGPLIRMPAALAYPMNMARYDWQFHSAPEPGLGGRRLACPRGHVIGGSSSINGMVYVRGHPLDFEHWRESGADGWGFADVAPYFRRLEHSHGGELGVRGYEGPLHVTRGTLRNPLYGAFIMAGYQAGYRTSADYNGRDQEGFGALERTVWRGQRWSAASAFLRPALRRSNARLVSGAHVVKIVFEGKRAIGAQFVWRGSVRTVKARRAVILSASSINSPKLLMLSGIGKGESLRAHGIDVVAARDGVGENLQDHLELYVQYRCRRPVSLYPFMNWLGKLAVGAQWFFLRRGIGASNQFEAGAFIRSRAGIPYPDIQYHFLPLAVRYDGKGAFQGHGFQFHVGPMRSASRGRVELRSAAPYEKPSILFNYMSQPQDWEDFRRCIRLTRELVKQPALARYAGDELAPGKDMASDDDEALNEFIRAHVESAYHPCGTCRMGARDDPKAVVAPDCAVIGVEGLYVIDSSIFPRITNGNLNAPSLMVGEKGADHVMGKALLPRDERPLEPIRGWKTRQR